MSLSEVLFHRSTFLHYYNCSLYDVDSIPLKQRQNFPHGVFAVVMGVAIEVLYIPCVVAIYRLSQEHRAPSCYMLMLYLGVIECTAVIVSTFCTAYFSFSGSVYCVAPLLMHACGCLAVLFFCAESIVVVMLAFNRCLIFIYPDLTNRLFRGRFRVTGWLLLPTVGALVIIMFTPPIMFDPIDGGAYFNPHRHYLPDNIYFDNFVNRIFNWAISCLIVVIYMVFAILFYWKRQNYSGSRRSRQKNVWIELNISVQVLITCIFVIITSIGFNYVDFFLDSFAPIILQAYIFYQGSPALIYLLMNRNIRNYVWRCIPLQRFVKLKSLGQPMSAVQPSVSRLQNHQVSIIIPFHVTKSHP